MKVKVLKPCSDNITFKMYETGAVIELSQERADKAIKLGLVAEIAEKKVEKIEKAEKKPTTKRRTKKED